jgi:hypothetical protein|tara:strand:+ start:388 stop:855 length:468 start_codon:yes stop_codon:yes gene_type:complete
VISSKKRKYGLMFALVLLCGFQFFLLPFIHYHPDKTHSHSIELSSHHHLGHFHSRELETLTNFIKHEDPISTGHHHSGSDDEHHHSDSFDDTNSVTLHKPKLVKGSSILKNASISSYFTITTIDSLFFFSPGIFYKTITVSPENRIARSPPAFLI